MHDIGSRIAMLTVCCFKWKPQNQHYRSKFEAEHVRILRNMVERQYRQPHRFVCITDDAKGLHDIEIVPIWNEFADIPSPHGGNNPSCYRRLKLFDPDIESILGKRFVTIDLDTVIVGNLEPLWDRPEDFVIWGETNPRSWYNGSMFMLTAGSRSQVYTQFKPQRSPYEAFRAGRFGSDQGWISHILGKGEATWGREDGVYSYRVHLAPKGGALPANARITFWHGMIDPWSYQGQQYPWVREHYC